MTLAQRQAQVANWRRALYLLPFALGVLVSACGIAPPPANGWAIVAADPQTGDVAVAGAACSEYPYDYRAGLVPNLGAGAQLGVGSPLHRDRFRAWIQNPWDASRIVQAITAPHQDAQVDTRQYGIVTIQKGNAHVATFSGNATAPYANALQDETHAVVVLGSGLVNEKVLRDSLAAFRASENVALTLSDKLMRALEAGSAAGGAALCNERGAAQTASTAFIMLARGGDEMFNVATLGNSAPQEPHPPYLALSVLEPMGGQNAVQTLRAQYNAWRQQHLPACAECLETRVVLAPGGALTTAPNAFVERNALLLVALFVIAVMAATIVYLVVRPRTGRSIHLAEE